MAEHATHVLSIIIQLIICGEDCTPSTRLVLIILSQNFKFKNNNEINDIKLISLTRKYIIYISNTLLKYRIQA